MGSGFGFTLGRSDGYPTRYGDQHIACHFDIVLLAISTTIVIFAVALFAILPAYNSFMRKILFCRILFSLVIGGIIICANYGYGWEKGVIEMSSPYKPGIPDEIKGELGLHISLRGINLTLIGEPFVHQNNERKHSHVTKYNGPLSGERINYNEHFSWEWAQGRLGFGSNAGRISRDFRDGLMRGLPTPILQVAEYFTFDGEGIRFGRHYRLAGWFAHLILWFALGTWLISNILFFLVVRTASFFLFLTGGLQLSAVAVWTLVRNPVDLQVPFQTADGRGEIILRTHFSHDYYFVLINGLFCVILSGIISLLDEFFPDEMCQCFGIDPLTIYDELLLTKEEIKEEIRRKSILEGKNTNDIEMQPAGPSEFDESPNGKEFFLRRRSHSSKIFRQSVKQLRPRLPRRMKGQSAESAATAPESRERQPLLNEAYVGSDSGPSRAKESQSWPSTSHGIP